MTASMGTSIGSIGAGIMGLNDFDNPGNAANQYLNQIPGITRQYLNPWNQMGMNAGNNLSTLSNQIMQNPGGYLNKMGSQFHQSPGFSFALNQAMMGNNSAAAAGGMAGSPQSQQQAMATGTQLGNQDYYNWLQHAQGLLGTGMQSQFGLTGLGENAGTTMANNIAQALSAQAGAAYGGATAKNSNNANAWGDIFGGLGGIADNGDPANKSGDAGGIMSMIPMLSSFF